MVKAKHSPQLPLGVYEPSKVPELDESVIRACHRDPAIITLAPSKSFGEGGESLGRRCHCLAPLSPASAI